jgi:zinc protease
LEKSKTNPVEQAKLFEQITKKAAKVTSQDEYNFSKQKLISDFENILKNSKTLMDYISQYWAIEQIITDKADSKTLTESFFGRTTNLYEQNLDEIKQLHQNEQPFVFVLVNSKTYKNYRTAFKKAGYEAVDIKNGSWYTQKLYKNAILGISEEKLLEEKKSTTTQDFFSDFEKNNSQNFDSFTLQNGIPVTVKSNNQTSNAVILISIKGGKLADKGNSGFTNVMTNAFASNIQNEIYKQKYFGTIKGTPEILAETNLSFSTISVECNYEDLENCIKAISDALIFGEILPADADSYVYSVQTQKRLYNGSPVNQLYSKAINYLYSSADYKNAFDSEKDILEFTNYLDILEAYPKFLNASLYNVVIIGNTNTEQIKTALEKSIGQLSTPNSKTEIKPLKIPEPNFTKSKKLSVKIRHLFYTDVAAEDAGPMPAILVPTKNFEDPVQFWVKSPEATSKEFAYFSALSFYLADQMEELGSNQNITSKIQIVNASKNIPAASFTFLNVAKVSNVNTLYKNTIANLKEKLKNPETNIIHDIKISWLMNTLSSTQTNRGTAILINEGINNFGDSKKYIKDYELIANSPETDFLASLNDYFPEEAQLRLYSADAK